MFDSTLTEKSVKTCSLRHELDECNTATNCGCQKRKSPRLNLRTRFIRLEHIVYPRAICPSLSVRQPISSLGGSPFATSFVPSKIIHDVRIITGLRRSFSTI